MRLIIGGLGQGMLEYALTQGYTAEDVTECLPSEKKVLNALEKLTRENPCLTADEISNEVVICQELGCGIVPMDAEERDWRERTGRLCCELAKKAERVDRVFCGIAMQIK